MIATGFGDVLEGILDADWYRDVLLRLVDDHRGTSRCYLDDQSFDEAVRRHATRPVADVFGVDELRRSWRGCQPVDGLEEARVTGADTLESTVARVLRDCWS